jgi:hypothetical protein
MRACSFAPRFGLLGSQPLRAERAITDIGKLAAARRRGHRQSRPRAGMSVFRRDSAKGRARRDESRDGALRRGSPSFRGRDDRPRKAGEHDGCRVTRPGCDPEPGSAAGRARGLRDAPLAGWSVSRAGWAQCGRGAHEPGLLRRTDVLAITAGHGHDFGADRYGLASAELLASCTAGTDGERPLIGRSALVSRSG